MRVSQRQLADHRPRWLGGSAVKLGVLCLFIVLVDMASPRMSKDGAGVVLVGGIVLLVLGAAGLSAATRIVARVLGAGRTNALLSLLRHTGLPLLGLAFFLTWTFVYIGMWWFRPGGAFTGLDAQPRFADFFYYAVSTGLISPPGDIVATSRGARSATLIEMLTGLALVGVYLSSFSGLLGGDRSTTEN